MIKSTKFIGKHWHHFDVTDSTNAEAARLLQNLNAKNASKTIHGTLLTTFNQIQGVGQRGNSWQCAPNKNLAFSLILQNVPLLPSEYFLLNMATALSVHATIFEQIETHKPTASYLLKIKWPNDIFFDAQKLSGMLLQNLAQGNTIASTIIGIGINVNQTVFDNLPDATALCNITGVEHDLWQFIERLSLNFENFYQLLLNSPEKIKERYHQNLYKFNEPALYKRRIDNKFFEGTILSVTNEGKLEMQTRQGTELFVMQEIMFINANN